MVTQNNKNVLQLSEEQPVLLIFLRHFGCTFCREAMDELHEIKSDIQKLGAKLVFVYLSTEELAHTYFQRYGLEEEERIADPQCMFYKEFGLVKGNFNQLFGFRTWVRGFDSILLKGHGFGAEMGDGFQMPGVFVISNGNIVSKFIHKEVSDKPNYIEMLRDATIQ